MTIFLIAAAAVVVLVLGGTALWVFTIAPRLSGGQGKQAKKAPKKREELRLGYRYDSGDTGTVFVHQRAVWTGVRLPTKNLEYATDGQMEAAAIYATNALGNISKEGEPVKIQYRLTHQSEDPDEWKRQLLANAWDPTDMYETLVNKQATFLNLLRHKQPVGYLLVQIDTLHPSKVDQFHQQLDAILTGEADDMIAPDLAAQWEAAAERVHRALDEAIPGCTPMTRADRMWLIRKPLAGCYDPAMGDFPATKPWGPGEYALWVDFEGDNLRHSIRADMLNADVHEADRNPSGEHLSSFTACLAIADWPAQSSLRQDWIKFFASHGVEVSFRAEVVPAGQRRGELNKLVRGIDSEIAEFQKSKPFADVPDDLLDAKEGAEAARLAAQPGSAYGRQPGLRWQMLVQVSAPTQKELDGEIDSLITATSNELGETLLVRPRNYQWRMLESMLPGPAPDLGGRVPFVRVTTAEVFGLGQPTAGVVVGDEATANSHMAAGWRGDLIGWGGADETLPTMFSAHSSMARHKPAGVAILGSSGGGKTQAAQLKMFQDSESGVHCRVLDPKEDFAAGCYYIAFGSQVNDPRFVDEVRAGTLGGPESRFQPINREFWEATRIIDVLQSEAGSLEPWAISPTVADGTLLANEMLEMFLGPVSYHRYREFIRGAVATVVENHEAAVAEGRPAPLPTLWQVAELLQTRAAALPVDNGDSTEVQLSLRGAARELNMLRHLPGARLAFAQNPRSLQIDDQSLRRVVMTLRGINLPSSSAADSPEKWSERDRIGATIMYALVQLNNTLLHNSPMVHPRTGQRGMTRPKALFVDESYVVTSMQTGRDLLRRMMAQGRAYNLAVVLIDQHARRLALIENQGASEGVGLNTIQTVMAFTQGSAEDAASVAAMLSNTNTDRIARSLLPAGDGGQLVTGRCIMRDSSNRTAKVHIDPMFTELGCAFETGPKTRGPAQSRQMPASVNDWNYLFLEPVPTSLSLADEEQQVSDPDMVEVH